MPLFKKREPEPASPSWSPTVDLDAARPVVFALANAPVSNDAQVRSAIAQFVRLSGRPPVEEAIHTIQRDPDVLHRPWIWLAAVMQEASSKGDHHLAAAGLFWACYWTSNLVPRNNTGSFMELELDAIPEARRAEIAARGVLAARELPADFVVIGDHTGQVHAGLLAETANKMLSL